MKENVTYRQGDVLVRRVEKIPAKAKARKRNGRIVLAEGEVTGHAHAIADAEALLFDFNEELYLQADGEVTLRHEEHAPISLPPGDYQVIRQREYSPEAIRNVAD